MVVEKESRKKNNCIYEVLWEIGKISGCHQREDRSLFYKNKQFPVCSRCTGVFIGYLIGGIIFYFYKIPVVLSIAFCLCLFLDWFIQYKKWKESNNVRRVITGILCGFAVIQLFLLSFTFCISSIIQ